MPSAQLDSDCWNEIKSAYEQGVDDPALSADFGVSREAIRQRRLRDKRAGRPWLNQAMIKAEQQKAQIDRNARITNSKTLSVTSVTAEQSVASRLQEIAERNSLRVAKMADKALREVADSPPEVESWADAGQAYKLLRLAAGLDKEGSQVSLNFGAMFKPQAGSADSVVVVVESSEGGV